MVINMKPWESFHKESFCIKIITITDASVEASTADSRGRQSELGSLFSVDRLLICRRTERPSEICKSLEVYQISTFPAKNAQEFLLNLLGLNERKYGSCGQK